MGKGKIVSLKKFVRGINAGTGILSQAPGTIVRVSNLNFTQRGSLQTIDGSAIIGQLVAPNTQAAALGTFSSFVSGQYPYYLALASTSGFTLPNITGITAMPLGATTNPAGAYLFAISANGAGGLHSDPQQGLITVNAVSSFSEVDFTWTMDSLATSYSIYYLPGGPGSTQGVLIASPTGGSFNFVGALPTTPLVELPVGNNSFLYQLQIGNIQPPSKQVFFTTTANKFPASLPEPAQVAPGDPNFQFQEGGQSTQTYTGNTISIFSVTGNGTLQHTAAGYPNLAVSGSQTVILNLTAAATAVISSFGPGSFLIEFQYSTDGGATFKILTTLSNSVPGGYTFPAFPLSQIITGLTNLSQLVIAITITVSSSGSGDAIADALVSSNMVTVTTAFSFTPYGGAEGFADPIPQILQFAAVTTNIPALPITVAILILGNGLPPQQFDPTLLGAATCTALTNTFTSLYPPWQASVNWTVGTIIAVTVSGTTYTFICTQPGLSAATEPTFTAKLGAVVIDGQAIWQNTGTLASIISPRGAAHGIVYAGSLWLFNTSPETTQDQIDGPTCLKMSDSGNPNSWNPANIAFLGKDDGTQGTGMTTFTVAQVGVSPTESLVCFKEFSTYQVLGIFGAPDFQITQAQTDLGCIAARSIQFLAGFGIARLTHEGFALFNGVNDKLISEEIRPYLYGGTGLNADIIGVDFTFCYLSQGAQTSKPPQYLCACPLMGANGSMTRLFMFDMVLKAWTILDLPWAITVLLQARTGEGNPLTIGFRGDGTGALERFFAGDSSWDAASLVGGLPATATPIAWNFQCTYVYEQGSSSRAFYRSVTIRGFSTAGVASLVTVSLQIDGNPPQTFQPYVYPQPGSGQFQIEVDILVTGQIANLQMSGRGPITVDGLDWEVTPKQGGRLMIG